MDRLTGADIVWITPEDYKMRDRIFEEEAERLRRKGRHPYVIPEGASDPLGAWGYIRAFEELAADIARLPGGPKPATTIVHATGSGGTDAGLILGKKLLNSPVRVVSVNVCDDRDYFTRVIGDICEGAVSRFGLDVAFARDRDIEIIDGYVGAGYALSRPEELALIRDLARAEGIFLDPVYTGKAFYGMAAELKKAPGCLGERIIFIHTGGLYGLFPKAGEIAPLIGGRG
jgi:D-cysteine desulfhydrase